MVSVKTVLQASSQIDKTIFIEYYRDQASSENRNLSRSHLTYKEGDGQPPSH